MFGLKKNVPFLLKNIHLPTKLLMTHHPYASSWTQTIPNVTTDIVCEICLSVHSSLLTLSSPLSKCYTFMPFKNKHLNLIGLLTDNPQLTMQLYNNSFYTFTASHFSESIQVIYTELHFWHESNKLNVSTNEPE